MNLDINNIIGLYLKHYTDETERLETLKKFTLKHKNGLFNRSNMDGHITASGVVIDKANNKMLLVHHKAHNKWLQPGGHVDASDTNLVQAALRELKEETGIKASELKLIGLDSEENVPVDVDTHSIESRPEKAEGQHIHFDFRFLFEYTGNHELSLNNTEVKESDWRNISTLHNDPTHEPLIVKIWHLLSTEFRTKRFYDSVLQTLCQNCKTRNAIVVTHIIPDCLYYLRAINKIWPIAAVVPKPKSIDKIVFAQVKQEFKVCNIRDREHLYRPRNPVVKTIRSSPSEKQFILFDIGGYFSRISNWPSLVRDKIELIIEDTENGHQKYINASLNIPVVSVARSPLKENEDFLVGQSILFSADALLRQGSMLLQYLRCGVMGYGKIGKSIAFHLLQRGVKPLVFDKNPIRRLEAHNRLCSVPEASDIVSNCDAIFCATGNKCLDIDDFRNLKSGCLVFSVTSSDDELDISKLQYEYQKEEIGKHIFKYSNAHNFFFLVNDGNAVNFIHNAVMGPFIHLVRAEMLAAAADDELINKHTSSDELIEVGEKTRSKVAEIWFKEFEPETRKFSSMEYVL